MKNIKLNNDREIPQLGLGTWKMKLNHPAKPAVLSALKIGYRHIDTAQIYLNQGQVGAAIAESGIPREQIFVTTKIWNGNQAKDKLMPSFENSLRKLRTDYVDMLLIHFPVTETRAEAWKQLEEIYHSGRANSIGVSNYTVKHLKELLKHAEVIPAVNQVELHVYLQQPELVKFCQDNGIVLEAYSPLAHNHGLDNEVLQTIGAKYKKTAAQVMLRWCIEQGFVTIPKSNNAERQAENLDIFDFELDKSDLAKIKKLDSNLRTCWDPSDVK